MSLRNPFRADDGAALDTLPPAEPESKGISGRLMRAAVERALQVQQPAVVAHIAKVRKEKPELSPAQVIAGLDKQFLIAVAGTGAAAGGAAFVPGIGTVVSLGAAAAEAVAALNASVLYALAVAEVHGVRMEDVERRRALVLAVVLGEGGTQLMQKVTGRKTQWADELANVLPLPKLGPLNQILVRWFVKRFARRQGALAIGRAMPLGVGAVIGAVGNLATGRGVIRATARAFGPPPASWPDRAISG